MYILGTCTFGNEEKGKARSGAPYGRVRVVSNRDNGAPLAKFGRLRSQ